MDVLREQPTNAQPCAGRFFTIGGAINWRLADARDGLIVGGELALDALLERLQLAGQYNDEHALVPVQCDSLRSLNR